LRNGKRRRLTNSARSSPGMRSRADLWVLSSRHWITGFPGDCIGGQRVQNRTEAISLCPNCFEPLSVAAKFCAQTANMGVYCPCNYRILILQNVESKASRDRVCPRRSIRRVSSRNSVVVKSSRRPSSRISNLLLSTPKSTHFQNFRVWPRARTPQQGVNAQNQLAHAEWLDQIVVGSKLQTFNPLAGFTSGGKDEDRK
jgi:hypothetical protein